MNVEDARYLDCFAVGCKTQVYLAIGIDYSGVEVVIGFCRSHAEETGTTPEQLGFMPVGRGWFIRDENGT